MEIGFSDFSMLPLLLFSCSSQDLGGSLSWIPWPQFPIPWTFSSLCPTPPGAAEILFHSQQILLLTVGSGSSSQHRRVTEVFCCFGPCRPVGWSVALGRLRIAEPGAARVIAAASAPARTCCLPHLSSPARAYRRAWATWLRPAGFLLAHRL